MREFKKLSKLILVLCSFSLLQSCRLFNEKEKAQSVVESVKPGLATRSNDSIKAIWISLTDSEVLHSNANVKVAVNRVCKDSLFNTILPIVYTRGKIYYKSQGLSDKYPELIDKELSSANTRDILQEFIDEAKKCDRPLKVFPWVEYGLRVPDRVTDSKNLRFMEFTNAIKNKHPKWLLDGTYPRTPTFQHSFLDPRVDGVQNFFLELCAELLNQYPSIAGLNIDDNFSVSSESIRDALFRSRGIDTQRAEMIVLPEDEFDELVSESEEGKTEPLTAAEKAVLVESEQLFKSIRNAIIGLFARVYDLHAPKFGELSKKKKVLLFTPHEGIKHADERWLIDIKSMTRGKNPDYIKLFPHGYRASVALDVPAYLTKLYKGLGKGAFANSLKSEIFEGVAVLSGTKTRYTRTPELISTVTQLESQGLGYAMFFYETILGKYTYKDRVEKLKSVMSK